MKKYAYLFSFFTVLLLSGYFIFTKWQESYASSAWDFVPGHAVLVVESTDALKLYQKWEERQPLQELVAISDIKRILAPLDTLHTITNETFNFFERKQILASLHVTAKDEVGFLFYFPIKNSKEQEYVNNFLTAFKQNKNYHFNNRNFQGFTLTEVFAARTSAVFSFFIHNKTLIGSYTPLLVEDVIRSINGSNADINKWRKINTKDSSPLALSSDFHLYILPQNLPKLLNIFTNRHWNHTSSTPLACYAEYIQLQASIEDNYIKLDGKSFISDKKGANNFLSIFREQVPQPLSCTSLIPTNTAILYRWGFNDAKKLAFTLQSLHLSTHPHQNPPANNFRESGEFNFKTLFNWIDNEIALSILESNEIESDKLIFIKAEDINKAIDSLASFTASIDNKKQVSSYSEKYGNIEIRQINITEFPAKLLGDLFNGFSQCFYAPINNHIIFSNNSTAIKELIENIREENVWSTSGKQNALLKQMASKDNFSVFINTPRAWNFFHHHASPAWQEFMDKYGSNLKNFEQASLQISYKTGNEFATTFLVNYKGNLVAEKLQNKFFVNTNTALEYSLYTSPFVVRNHQNRSLEVVTQDVMNQLYLISNKGKILWKKGLGSKIISAITQIDFYKNNKLQYLFATPKQLMLIDRNGNMVDNFPIQAPTTWHTLAAIDYDNNKDYRFLASDLQGNLYMYNTQLKALNGWNPLKTGYRFSSAARHIRVQGKDYIIGLQANGTVLVLNRRGQPYTGFPLLIQSPVNNPLFIEPGTTAEKTILTALTDGGEIIRFNLLGNIVERRQLYRPSRKTSFKLCVEAQQQDWIIARYDTRTISVLNKSGQPVFEKDCTAASEPNVQYYDFGAGFRIIAVTLPNEQQTFLYDYKGNLIGDNFLQNSHPVAILYNDDFEKLMVYHTNKKKTSIVSLKIK